VHMSQVVHIQCYMCPAFLTWSCRREPVSVAMQSYLKQQTRAIPLSPFESMP